MMALVLGPMAASILSASMLCVRRSTSTKHGDGTELDDGIDRGRKARRHADDLVALFDGAFPSLGEVNVLKATRLADEPELTVIRCLTPMKAASFFSNSALKRPVVSQPSSEGVHHVIEFGRVQQLAGGRHHGAAGQEQVGRQRNGRIFFNELGDLRAQGLGLGVLHNERQRNQFRWVWVRRGAGRRQSAPGCRRACQHRLLSRGSSLRPGPGLRPGMQHWTPA